MRVLFSTIARDELNDARAWLNHQQPGLGRQLNDEVREAAMRIARMPLLHPVDIADVRKCHLSRFPYTLRYALRGDIVLILAVSHQHREPDYWIDRIR
ncbi:MAG: type II toxin-antitoxin system RelE/ParE family toxin [Rhodocyclaceae bacterium]|nr:type II toxin-antitoxin system RelE/ParE family toxin [Rhodocyclaceae bacterium]